MGRKAGPELGPGFLQLGAVMDHRAGPSTPHEGMKLLVVVGDGGRAHGYEKLHGVSLLSLKNGQVLGGGSPCGAGSDAPTQGTPNTSANLLYIRHFPIRNTENSGIFQAFSHFRKMQNSAILLSRFRIMQAFSRIIQRCQVRAGLPVHRQSSSLRQPANGAAFQVTHGRPPSSSPARPWLLRGQGMQFFQCSV